MRNLIAFILFSCLFCNMSYSQERKAVKTMKEVSIIGNSELPSAEFDLPWRLPSVDKREDESPVKDVPGLIRSIEPYRYKQQIYFTKYLEVDTPRFIAR